MTDRKEINRILSKNHRYYDFDIDIDGNVEINVEWGDWKHDHLFLKSIMAENGFMQTDEVVTEEDGDDAYSSTHFFTKIEGD